MHGDFEFGLDEAGSLAQLSQNITTLSFWSEGMNPTVCKSRTPPICGKVNENVEVNSENPRIWGRSARNTLT